jgi:hypothetical protein
MRRTLTIALAILLSGCGFGSVVIKSESLSFGDVIEETTNKLLVLNLLRARDKAPLHFADIPVIRESVQQTASMSWLQFLGRLRVPTQVSDSQTFGASIQMTPSFEITHLHSKDFITGISSPIDPKVVKYWLDRGLDRRLALLLFFSAVEITETQSEKGPVSTIRINNSPRDAVDIIKARTQAFTGPEAILCDRQSDFERYLKLLNRVKTFFAHSYRERRLIARDLNPGSKEDSKNLQAFAALDQSKMQLVLDRERGTYNVWSLSTEQKVAFCFYGDADAAAATTASAELGVIESGRELTTDRRTCFQSVVDVGIEEAGPRRSPSPVFFPGAAAVQEPSRYCGIFNRFGGITPKPAAIPGGYPRLELRLFIRSVGEIFQFLGDLLHYQEEIRRHLQNNPGSPVKLNIPVTFGFCGDTPDPGCNDIFLRLDADPCNARFSVAYRDRQYHVANYNPSDCAPEPTGRRDHTLEVLAVLHQLVGINRSAADIRQTPAVQLLP